VLQIDEGLFCREIESAIIGAGEAGEPNHQQHVSIVKAHDWVLGFEQEVVFESQLRFGELVTFWRLLDLTITF